MGFMDDIDKGLQTLAEKLEKEDPAFIRVDCPNCGAEDIKVHKMRARHGHARCPECGAQLVVMMERN